MLQCGMKNTSQAIILFAHGSRAATWREPFDVVTRKFVEKHPQARVELAFLEFMSPTLNDSLVSIATDGIANITIVPLFFGVGNHVARDLKELVDAFSEVYADVNVHIAPALGTSDAILNAMSDYASSFLNVG